MKKLKIDLNNCHGIHRLDAELSFKDARATAIYAPNGMMKTSFARTFGDLSLMGCSFSGLLTLVN